MMKVIKEEQHRPSGRFCALIALFALALGLFGCTRGEPKVPVPAECRAGILLSGTPLTGRVRRVSLEESPPIRLVEQPFEVESRTKAASGSAVERFDARAVGKWPVVQTPLGARRRSGTFETPIERAGSLAMEIGSEAGSAIDVTVIPSGRTLNEIEQLHRTVRLDFPARDERHVFEIALQPLLLGNWPDDQSSGATHFQVEMDAGLPVEAIQWLEVRSTRARFEGPAGRTLDGPRGALRPSFHLRSGASFKVSIPPSEESRTLVFYLTAPVGRPSVAVRLDERPPFLATRSLSRDGWSRHQIELPPGSQGELRFEARGKGVALIGDPTVWSPRGPEQTPDVVLYMIDTLLASRIGAFGSDVPDVSPAMDALADESLAFVRAISTSAWTKPAIASLMTGVYPLTHRVGTRNYTDRVPDRAPLLQERFRRAGFRTISSSASPLGSTLSGLERGFDLAHPPARWSDEIGPLGHPSSLQVQDALLAFVDEDPSRPVFAYLHTLEVHEYERPMFADGSSEESPYDRAVRHQDAALGALVEAYEARNRDLILVLLSDHGEGFGEYGLEAGHGYSLRQNQLHVPLAFHGPSWLPRGRSIETASLVDVAPTLLDLFSLPPLPRAQGRSLLPDAEVRGARPAVYAERTWFLWDHQGPSLLARVDSRGRKLVMGYPTPLSWDLARSPCEKPARLRPSPVEAVTDLLRFQKDQAASARWWDATYGASPATRIDTYDIARLRALGYLQ